MFASATAILCTLECTLVFLYFRATNEDNPRSVSQSTEIKPLPIWKLVSIQHLSFAVKHSLEHSHSIKH